MDGRKWKVQLTKTAEVDLDLWNNYLLWRDRINRLLFLLMKLMQFVEQGEKEKVKHRDVLKLNSSYKWTCGPNHRSF